MGNVRSKFDVYFEYNKILRTWFVAFGVGGPALFLVNDRVAAKLVEVGSLKLVAVLFLVGVACQVAGSCMNKWAAWFINEFEGDDDKRQRSLVGVWAVWHGRSFWIDGLIDIVTIGCFGVSLWHLLTVFGK